jgi:selenium metabolism protein YedF
MKSPLDMRGRPCPEPVVETQKALKSPGLTELEVLVDNEAALENVSRLGRSMGCDVTVESSPTGDHRIFLKPDAAGPIDASDDTREIASCCTSEELVVLVPTDRFGDGDPDLGRALLLAFVNTLKELVPKPKTLILLNNGAKLPCRGSEFVEPLRKVDDMGCEILVCGTCLDFYHLEDALEVGRVTNMLEIATILANADKVIRV